MKYFGNLLDGVAVRTQEGFGFEDYVVANPFRGGAAAEFHHCGAEVFGRYAEFCGVESGAALRCAVLANELKKIFKNLALTVFCGFRLLGAAVVVANPLAALGYQHLPIAEQRLALKHKAVAVQNRLHTHIEVHQKSHLVALKFDYQVVGKIFHKHHHTFGVDRFGRDGIIFETYHHQFAVVADALKLDDVALRNAHRAARRNGVILQIKPQIYRAANADKKCRRGKFLRMLKTLDVLAVIADFVVKIVHKQQIFTKNAAYKVLFKEVQLFDVLFHNAKLKKIITTALLPSDIRFRKSCTGSAPLLGLRTTVAKDSVRQSNR